MDINKSNSGTGTVRGESVAIEGSNEAVTDWWVTVTLCWSEFE